MNEAFYCRNGHFIGYDPKGDPALEYVGVYHDYQKKQIQEKRKRLSFCPDCGAPAVKACEHCNATIERDPYYTAKPLHCSSCGTAFPWTESALTAAKEYTDEAEGLTAEDKTALIATFHDLTVDTPKSELAAHRFKKFLKKLAPDVAEGIRKTIVEIASDAAAKLLNPGP
jgi:hypothetical protein